MIRKNKTNSHFDLINSKYKTFAKSKYSTRACTRDKILHFCSCKRSQQEIVGFILIVVIVVIIGLFLLVFYLRQPAVEYKSLNVQNFLQSSMIYTTECAISIEPLDMQELIESCKENRKCSNDKMACEVLNNTLSELVHESWLVSEKKPVNAYSLDIYYEESSLLEKQEILNLQEGNCTGSKTGAEHFLHYDRGNIIIAMDICYT